MDIKIKERPWAPRPITQDNMSSVLDKVRNGAPLKKAAVASGVGKSQVYNWVHQGDLDIDNNLNETLYAQFVFNLANIAVDEIVQCRREIKINQKGHVGAQWTLERVYRDEYGANAELMELKERLDRLEQAKAGGTPDA